MMLKDLNLVFILGAVLAIFVGDVQVLTGILIVLGILNFVVK
ncbi:Uncharacterised protein [uncultured archaeon]|nr:Uncharacterised protein [uncultured archaeon]